MKKLFIASLAFLLFLTIFNPVNAHPGNTAADGCHYCRTNCDKWGVPWNQRHCHGNSASAHAPTPTPQPQPTPSPSASVDSQVKTRVTNSKPDYFKDFDGFRESLMQKLVEDFPSAKAGIIANYIYTILPDVTCASNKFNCPDLITKEGAQKVYEKCMQEVGSDIHYLDADNDREVCETNK